MFFKNVSLQVSAQTWNAAASVAQKSCGSDSQLVTVSYRFSVKQKVQQPYRFVHTNAAIKLKFRRW